MINKDSDFSSEIIPTTFNQFFARLKKHKDADDVRLMLASVSGEAHEPLPMDHISDEKCDDLIHEVNFALAMLETEWSGERDDEEVNALKKSAQQLIEGLLNMQEIKGLLRSMRENGADLRADHDKKSTD